LKIKNCFFLVLSSAFILQGCSSIINGTTQKVSVNSNVQGGEVFIDGVTLGRTPVINARIKRKDTSFLVVKKDGYKDYQQNLQTRLDGWFWGNIVLGGVIGSTTDSVSGTTHLLDPDTIFVQMEPVNGTSMKMETPDEQKLRTFVTTSYSQLSKDIKAGKGDYLKSLLKLLKTPQDQEAATIKNLEHILSTKETIVDFTEEVVKLNTNK
jgi:hypothetical protein